MTKIQLNKSLNQYFVLLLEALLEVGPLSNNVLSEISVDWASHFTVQCDSYLLLALTSSLAPFTSATVYTGIMGIQLQTRVPILAELQLCGDKDSIILSDRY
jgi:hypothetical protein